METDEEDFPPDTSLSSDSERRDLSGNLEERMSKEEAETSPESSSSEEEIENLEDVQKLVVKSSTEETKSKDFGSSTPEKEPEVDLEQKDYLSTPTKADEDQDMYEIKDKDEMMSMEDEELKREEERREKMKVLLTGYLELKTKKEIEKAMLNEKKILSQWLYPFRASYQKEWELEMKKLRMGFQKTLDYKKSHIHAIQRERKLVELNHLWADSAYYRTSEELFDFMRMRCEKLKNNYLEELEETKKYYLEREKEIIDKCTKVEERANVLAFIRKSVRDKTLQKTKETLENFKTEGEFFRAKEIDTIKEKHRNYVQMIAEELQTSISPPEHRMDEIRALFEEWKRKYDGFLESSDKNRRELEQLGEELPSLELRVSESKKKLEGLQAENKMIKQKEADEIIHFQKFSRRYESMQPALRKMITASEEVMVKLRERKVKLNKILKLKKFCDQLEFESDKIRRQNSFLDEEELNQIVENDRLPLVRELCSDDVEDHNLLENLHRKLSCVKLQNKSLLCDIGNLRVENMALRSDMRKYLHLIVSGEWQRIPESELQSMCEIESSPETQCRGFKGTQSGKDDTKNLNLKMLDSMYGAMNEKIIKRAENM